MHRRAIASFGVSRGDRPTRPCRRRAKTHAPDGLSLGAMNKMRLIFGLVLFAACVMLDVWFVSARCSASPPVFMTGIVLGGGLQLLSFGVPLLAVRWFDSASVGIHLRGAAIGALCLAFSVPVLQASILYSDGIGKDKQYRSVGLVCGGPALRSGYGT
jgi:hypothetical protein